MKSHRVLLLSAHIGCKPNSIISSRLYNYLTINKHKVVMDIADADYVIVNTCGFEILREQISIKLLSRPQYAETKLNVISVGCLNKINRDLVSKVSNVIMVDSLEELDKFFYRNKKFEECKKQSLDDQDLIHLNTAGAGDEEAASDEFGYFLKTMKLFLKMLEKVGLTSVSLEKVINEFFSINKFYLEISSGCLGNCSYCIIKKARGSLVSRTIDEIIDDLKNGYDEKSGKIIHLVADDCGCYGLDIKSNLYSLISEIQHQFPGASIDICYLSPKWILNNEEQYLDIFRKCNINNANITIQSGSEEILKLMNRGIDIKKLFSFIAKVREISPHTAIWSHFLVGFPGEGVTDFIKSVAALRYFDFAYAYSYSDREGTPSSNFPDKNSEFQKLVKYYIMGAAIVFKILIKSFRISLKKNT